MWFAVPGERELPRWIVSFYECFSSACSYYTAFQGNAQPSPEVMNLRGLGICPNKPFEEVYAEAEISKTGIPGQECPACEVVKLLY